MEVIRGAKSSPKPGGPRRYSRIQMQKDAARQAAIDRSLSKYLHLLCGHYSTLETDLFYSHLRPKRGFTWCEICNDWVEIARPPSPPTYPDDPAELF